MQVLSLCVSSFEVSVQVLLSLCLLFQGSNTDVQGLSVSLLEGY